MHQWVVSVSKRILLVSGAPCNSCNTGVSIYGWLRVGSRIGETDSGRKGAALRFVAGMAFVAQGGETISPALGLFGQWSALVWLGPADIGKRGGGV